MEEKRIYVSGTRMIPERVEAGTRGSYALVNL
nr:MAG TPA: hypothetical protein [Caudoviricetes sp.]